MRAAALDPLDAAAIRVRHRELLDTLRELLADAGDLRAILAFLRQSVVPAARREEALLLPEPDVREAAAFEHAFLEAEIDRLGREAADLAAARDDAAREAAGRRVRRTLHRIEAVLELHVLREDDRGILASDTPYPAGP